MTLLPHRCRNALALIRSLALLVMLTGVALKAGAADDSEQEHYGGKFQFTYNWQQHLSFKGIEGSRNSLSRTDEHMFTMSATAHLGARLWDGAEVYFDPEIASGVPFSGALVGLGSFTNGEITRAGGADPKYYRQRLFLRQTWNNGGGTQKVESDFNQLAGSVDRDRFVLTIGNFSTLDVFDDNNYAKDPRTQFMNWGHWTYAAYDYAADARGFGWGLAGEWYKDDWVLRFGRMTGPRVPNGLPTDYRIWKHYGDQLEIEHGHTLNGQPGKVRLLGWRNRAVTASFKDALAYYTANEGTQGFDPETILQVRHGEKIKYGLGINLEQAINDQIGVFLRAMQADGRTETYAFTEVDASLSLGVMAQGSAWGRERDSAGVAFGMNRLSDPRRRYLESGALSFFIGDGSLSYAAEKNVELFYSLGLIKGTWLTADYQHIENPAYNSSRGPVNVFAFRFHAEY